MEYIKIGNVKIKRTAALAPMASVADRAYRILCREYGACYTVSELISAKGLCYNDKKTAELCTVTQAERPMALQLFGSEPEFMKKATEICMTYSPDIIDINMGCPAPKVAGNGGGSALMAEPEKAAEIVNRVVNAVKIPVTVKMRTGIDFEHITAPKLAVLCEQAGAAAITVHGRTRAQMYAPPVDRETIKRVKESVNIPVIANGDITDGKSAEDMLIFTKCDFLMVGRAARGNPFIFEEINAAFEGKSYTPPTLEKRLKICLEQIRLMEKYKDPHIAVLESRKHLAWYISGIRGAAALRRECGEVSSFKDAKRICEKALEQNALL